jgi:pyruvate ferredoxin oxidoreductase beta subunit
MSNVNTTATIEKEDFSLRTMLQRPERLTPGHRMCAGCGATIGVRAVLRALHEGDRAVIGNATGCLEVSSYMYPYTSWEDSYIHNAFENAGATLSGVETAYKALRKSNFAVPVVITSCSIKIIKSILHINIY